MPDNENSVNPTSNNPAPVTNSPNLSSRLIPMYVEASFITKTLVVAAVTALIMIGGYLFLSWLLRSQPVDPAYAKVDSIKRVKHLRLVKHHYEGIIPVTNPKGNLQFLMIAPADINGFIDLSEMRFEVGRDSLIKIVLPDPEISKVRINLNETKEYTWKKNKWFLGRSVEVGNYFKAYNQIRIALAKSKADVEKRARINGIEEETTSKAKDYIRNMVNGMGYRVEFYDTEEEAFTPIKGKIQNNMRTLMQEYLDEQDPDKAAERFIRLRETLGLNK